MDISRILEQTWRPALGCTEPASIAYAAALAAAQSHGEIMAVSLRCDPRVFKNCFAVGIPNSGGRTGILWAMAIGSLLPDPSLKLECFRTVDDSILEAASRLMARKAVQVDAVVGDDGLYVDCRVVRTGGVGRAVIEGDHVNVVVVERDGVAQKDALPGADAAPVPVASAEIKGLSIAGMLELVRGLTDEDRRQLREGVRRNQEIAGEGLGHFKGVVAEFERPDPVGQISRLVFSGVHARMSGSSRTVMAASGSGNKGITSSLPVVLYGEEIRADVGRIDEALALSVLLTDVVTRHLGTLSAICGCTNASGIGLAAGLVYLRGGDEKEISHAVSNMVGNISGIICDGAKIGCALKAMTAVDAAFRAAALAMGGVCIPVTDGIVGEDGMASLRNLGRIANRGMSGLDDEILQIMKHKLLV
jgi:L-cysteine desulfidase